MRIVRASLLAATVAVLAPALPFVPRPAAAVLSAQQNPERPPPQDEFVPIDQLPPQEELPAAPMVVAAYSFIWVAFVVYCIGLVRRVKKIEADLLTLEKGRR
jgi:hypothetical protein